MRKRCVFYVSGFDPKGAAHYYTLYKHEAARQAEISGISIAGGRRQKTEEGNSFWICTAQLPDGLVETRYEFLRWDDIVREHWPRSTAILTKDLISTSLLNLRTGALWRMFKLAWPPVLAIFLPFVLLCAVVVLTPVLIALVVWATPTSWGGWAAGLACLAAGGGWLGLARQLEKKFNMVWLLRSYAFTARQAQGLVPQLDRRLEQHAETLLARINTQVDDEVLIVGHSSGATMAATVLANALRRDSKLGGHGPTVSFLTLGQCMPLLSNLPMATRFHGDLQCLANAREIDWIDFSAPPDGCCFALVNPLLDSGKEGDKRTGWPKLLSPRFAEMFDPHEYAAIRDDRFRCHFQYLMASKKPVPFDYFAITAGNQTLAYRFRASASVTNYAGLRIF